MNSPTLWLCSVSLSVLFAGSFSSNSACPNSWTHDLGSCYIFGKSSETCYGANLICRAHGGTLVNINSQAENEFVHALLPTSGFDSAFCIGFFRSIKNPSNWFWLDGSNETYYTNWDTNQPGNYSEGCCMMLVENGTWHDYSCTLMSRSYICEKERFPVECHKTRTKVITEGEDHPTNQSELVANTDVDECQSPYACEANLVCQNTLGSYLCRCPLGFVAYPESLNPLVPICLDIDECYSPDACGSDHVCKNTAGSYTCECPLGYVADSGPQNPLNPVCVDFDECQSLDACGSGQVCNNTVGSYTCECSLGFVKDSGPQNPLDPVCVDLDECSNNLYDCEENTKCVNEPGSYRCICVDGYTGDGKICTDIDECVHSPVSLGCSPHSDCINFAGSFFCACKEGYLGDGRTCKEKQEVFEMMCEDRGGVIDAFDSHGDVRCKCAFGYVYDSETDKCLPKL